ncbi:MAG: MFS transporter [Halioglobus sp.]
MALVLMVTFFVGYLDRYNITFALPLMADEFGWSEQQTRDYGSLLMGIFFAAYGLANMFLTPFAARLGARRSMLVMVCLWSLFTAMGAWVSQWLVLLLATRVLLGLSEGVHVPMMSQLTKTWFPLGERARANSIFVSGLFLAVLLSPLMLVPLMSEFGWRWGFVLVAVFGLLISLPLVWALVYDSPADDPAVTSAEIELINAGRAREAQDDGAGLAWRALFLRPQFILLTVIGIINNVVALGFSSWLPTYFTHNRGIAFEDIALLVAVPYLFSIVGIGLWATLGDRFNIRAALAAVGYAGAGLLLYVALSAEALILVVACFSAGVFMVSAFNACEFAMLQRIVPLEKTAAAMGVYNGFTTLLGGGLGPFIVSPVISPDGPVWLISAIALSNALLLLWAYRLIRY